MTLKGLIGFLMVACLPWMAQAQLKTLYVARVKTTDALTSSLARDHRGSQLGRIAEALDTHLITRISQIIVHDNRIVVAIRDC
jgi:hypothetical protein